MKIKISLLILTLFTWNISFSQTHFFSLDGQKINLKNNSFKVTSVLDERTDKTNIGWTQKGMTNIKVDANFSNPFEKEIQDFLDANMDSKGLSLQVVIRTLKISERTSLLSEKGLCELAVDFLINKESTVYRVLQTSHTSEIKGIDVTKKHPQNIANAFKLCFEELAEVDLSNLSNFFTLETNGDIISPIPDSITYDFPIFKEKIKTGIFQSYKDLKNNSPSILAEFYVDKEARSTEPWIGTYNLIPKFRTTNKKVKDIWSFAYEGVVYVFHQKEYFPLTIENYNLYFYGYGVSSNESVSTGALVGGLIGAGIASGIENSNAKKHKIKYHLDPNTGGYGATSIEKDEK
jgi:hypothetical protein